MSAPTLAQPVPQLDITVKQGATFQMALCLIEKDPGGVVTVVDTAGWTIIMQIRSEPDPASPVLLSATTASGKVTVGIVGSPGEQINVDITIPANETGALTWFGCGGYDILAIYPSGYRAYLAQGTVDLQPAYSRE